MSVPSPLARLALLTLAAAALLALLFAVTPIFSLPRLSEANSAPATPDSVSLTRGDKVLTASWAAVDGADKYHVTYSSDGGGSWHAPVDDHTNISPATAFPSAWTTARATSLACGPATNTAGAAGATRRKSAPTRRPRRRLPRLRLHRNRNPRRRPRPRRNRPIPRPRRIPCL